MSTFTIVSALLLMPALIGQTPTAPKQIPSFSIRGSDGIVYSPTQLKGRPALFVLINSKCPHNPPAVPDLNLLRRQLGQNARLLALIDLGPNEARTFNAGLKLETPLLPDPQKNLILGLGGTHSLDLVLISRDGKTIAGKWGGVSRAAIAEIQAALRKDGLTSLRLDLARFSRERRSGCGF